MTVPGVPRANEFVLLGDLEPYRGNVVFLVRGDGRERVLKLYRRRRAPALDVLESLSQRVFECKRGSTAAERCATERLLLDLWSAAGVDVPARLDEPLPRGLGPSATWMEYCPGPLLSARLRDEALAWDARLDLIRRLAADLGRRNALALERGDARLAHEHATLNHVIVCGDRLVHVDLEGGFLASAAPLQAVGAELAGYLRSLEKCVGERFEEALAAFVEAHGRVELLRAAADRAVRGRGPASVLRRLRDRQKRGPRGKSWVMARLLDALSGSSGSAGSTRPARR